MRFAWHRSDPEYRSPLAGYVAMMIVGAAVTFLFGIVATTLLGATWKLARAIIER